ncbi:MAG: hypothetical protein MHM6MM_007780 [Cercozoa sp. M6MM]
MSGEALNLSIFGDELTTEQLVQLARVAEQAERYDDMCKFMKALVQKKTELSVDERNLLSVAYKNVVGARRASWRTLNLDEHKVNELVGVYRQQIEKELSAICNEVLELLKEFLLPSVKDRNDESEVFYLKMTGDYYRYLSEFTPGNADSESALQAKKHYQQALDMAKSNLHETHPTRLGLALNYSVCYFEILNDADKACALAREAFEEAIQKLDSLGNTNYKDSTLIMQLLRDNLTLWQTEVQEGRDVKVEDVDVEP